MKMDCITLALKMRDALASGQGFKLPALSALEFGIVLNLVGSLTKK